MAVNAEQTRNIALVSHNGAGKTSLAEVMLYKAGKSKRIGRVEDGNTLMDFEPEELKRQASLSSGIHQFEWKKHTINIIDTPGDQNFFTDTKNCMQGADSALFLVDAVDGVRVQTEQAWEFAADFNMPSMIFINKMEKERADFNKAFQDVIESLPDPKPILIQLPMGSEADFKGVIDLISMKAYAYDDSGKPSAIDIPADLKDLADTERENLIENIAEADDELIERYLEGETISDDELKAALKKGVNERIFVPVACGSATGNIGVDNLLDLVVGALPSPVDRGPKTGTDLRGENELSRSPDPDAPFSAFIFKTVADPYAGRLSIFRIVSGTLGSDGTFYNSTKETNDRLWYVHYILRFGRILLRAHKEVEIHTMIEKKCFSALLAFLFI